MDTISINRLALDTIVGCNPEEQLAPQRIYATITLALDLSLAGKSDDLAQTLDYAVLAEDISQLIESGRWKLIEHIAELIAQRCRKDQRVTQVTVTIEKPGALPRADSAAVTIIR